MIWNGTAKIYIWDVYETGITRISHGVMKLETQGYVSETVTWSGWDKHLAHSTGDYNGSADNPH